VALFDRILSIYMYMYAEIITVMKRFLTLQDISIPWAIQNLFYSIPQEMFRCDISSTWIRKQMQQEQQ